MFSQNLRLAGAAPDDAEFPHPAGASVARALGSAIAAAGWRVSDVDNWRDRGWSLVCHRGSADLQVALSEVEPLDWLIQIAPLQPTSDGNLFGDCVTLCAAARG